MALPDRRALERFLEMWLPVICGAATLCGCLLMKDTIVATFIEKKLSLPQLYTAVFGWASVMTGFLFGVYGLIIGKSDGFISDIKHTKAMQTFLSYTARAVVLGFVITLASIPFLVMNSEMSGISELMFVATAAYIALFVWGFVATARVAYIFSEIVRVPTIKRLPA